MGSVLGIFGVFWISLGVVGCQGVFPLFEDVVVCALGVMGCSGSCGVFWGLFYILGCCGVFWVF